MASTVRSENSVIFQKNGFSICKNDDGLTTRHMNLILLWLINCCLSQFFQGVFSILRHGRFLKKMALTKMEKCLNLLKLLDLLQFFCAV